MNELLVVGILFGLVLFRAVLVGMLTYLILHPVRTCPACLEGATHPVRKRWLVWAGRRLEWRWCVACGWEGLARKLTARDMHQELGSKGRRSPRSRPPRTNPPGPAPPRSLPPPDPPSSRPKPPRGKRRPPWLR